jgi:hypothetical protein
MENSLEYINTLAERGLSNDTEERNPLVGATIDPPETLNATDVNLLCGETFPPVDDRSLPTQQDLLLQFADLGLEESVKSDILHAHEIASDFHAAAKQFIDQISLNNAPPPDAETLKEMKSSIADLLEIASKIDHTKFTHEGIAKLAETHAHRDRNFMNIIKGFLSLEISNTEPRQSGLHWERVTTAAADWGVYIDNKSSEYLMVLEKDKPHFLQNQVACVMNSRNVLYSYDGDIEAVIPGLDKLVMRALYEEFAANVSKYCSPEARPEVKITIDSADGKAIKIIVQDKNPQYPGGTWREDHGATYSQDATNGGTGLASQKRRLEDLPVPYTLSFGKDDSSLSLGGNRLVIEPGLNSTRVKASTAYLRNVPLLHPPTHVTWKEETLKWDVPAEEYLQQLDYEEICRIAQKFSINSLDRSVLEATLPLLPGFQSAYDPYSKEQEKLLKE